MLYDHPVRLSGFVAGGLGLIAAFAAPGGAPAPRSPVTNLPAILYSVSADSPDDAWIAGNDTRGRGGALLLHWNGTSWSPVAVPSAHRSETNAVAALSPTNAWAVGAGPGRPGHTTLLLHWSGTTWARVPGPGVHSGPGTNLYGVSALTPDDALAVGDSAGRTSGNYGGLALRWNGTSWTKTSMPSPAAQSALNGVSAISPSDAWAVGTYFAGKREQSFIVHWNGSTWAVVPSPNPSKELTSLAGVSAVSSNDVWAVGDYFVGRRDKTLILHWNGTAWAQVPSPSPGRAPGGSGLLGVSALSSTDAWAVGSSPSGTLVLQWDGTSWTRVASPSPGGGRSGLQGVSADSPSDAWAVGFEENIGKGAGHSVILHWNGTSWQRS